MPHVPRTEPHVPRMIGPRVVSQQAVSLVLGEPISMETSILRYEKDFRGQ